MFFPKKWHFDSSCEGWPKVENYPRGLSSHDNGSDSQCDLLFNNLKCLLNRFPEAVGIGEVSLDLTTKCVHRCNNQQHCRDQKLLGQRRFLRLAFQLAKKQNKVLFLHILYEIAVLVKRQRKYSISLKKWTCSNNRFTVIILLGRMRSMDSGILIYPTVTLAHPLLLLMTHTLCLLWEHRIFAKGLCSSQTLDTLANSHGPFIKLQTLLLCHWDCLWRDLRGTAIRMQPGCITCRGDLAQFIIYLLLHRILYYANW